MEIGYSILEYRTGEVELHLQAFSSIIKNKEMRQKESGLPLESQRQAPG